MRHILPSLRVTSPRVSIYAAAAITFAAMISSALAQTAPTATPPNKQAGQGSSATSTLPAPVFIARQSDGEIRAANLIGTAVHNKANETVGDIVDVVFQADGMVTAVVIGVGGMLGLGEKNVAVPYAAIAITTGNDGLRSAKIDAQLSQLQSAPAYLSERTTFEKLQDGVSTLAKEAQKKAVEIKNNMSTPAPATTPAPAR